MEPKALLLILLIAAFMDMLTFKVKNWLVYTGMLAGFIYNGSLYGWKGIEKSIVGMLVPLIVLFILFCFRMLGAGDIKLICMIGTFLGLEGLIGCFIPILAAGAVYSLIKVIYQKNLMFRLQYLAIYIQKFIITKKIEPYYRDNMDKDAAVPLSVPILVGVLLYMGGVTG